MKKKSIRVYLYADIIVIKTQGQGAGSNQGSTLSADGDAPNAIVTFNFWREHRLIVVDRNRPRHFSLDMINQEQLLASSNT